MKISSETIHILADLGDREAEDFRWDEWDTENANSRSCSPLPDDYTYSFIPETGFRRIEVVMRGHTIHCSPVEPEPKCTCSENPIDVGLCETCEKACERGQLSN